MNARSENLILKTDSYKPSHWRQYPPGTRGIYSFFESRGGDFDRTVFFGLQYILKRHLEGVRVSAKDIEEAKSAFAAHFGSGALFNEAGWQRIVSVHGGRLPIRIKAVPEGSVIPTRNVLMTIEGTDPEIPWITNYLETLLSQVWYPTTVATLSHSMRGIVTEALEETGDPSLISFKVHDFGYRGSTSDESAGIGGAAHLVNFMGSDTLAGILVARDFYGEPMAGFSIPAAEHSTITAWGKEREADAYRHMLEQFPSGLVAVVSDSYDIYRACRDLWGKELREQVLARDGTLVIRPDSGDPHEVLPKILEILGQAFGATVNDKGYRVLNPKVRIIQGDGINLQSLRSILVTLKLRGWSADNIAFGSGGGLLQKVDRDTCKFAFKCSATEDGSGWQDAMKDPVTDPGKRSKAGRMKLIRDASGFATVRESAPGEDLLETVFENGTLLREQSFADIRARAAKA